MKAFQINYKDGEKQFVAANTNIEALQEVLSVEETDLSFMLEIIELDDSLLDSMTVSNSEYDESDKDDWEKKTFREVMSESEKAQIISSTFYE